MTDEAALERALWALRAYDTVALATSSAAGPHVAGVFFAPERNDTGIRLLIATRGGSRLQRELEADPRVAFMCSPGNASRWIQGGGIAAVVTDAAARTDIAQRLIEHAAGAQAYVEGPEVLPVTIEVGWLKVVEARDGAHLVLRFDS
jgi:pyridoxamine 5'-phosphate oxidase-like protein